MWEVMAKQRYQILCDRCVVHVPSPPARHTEEKRWSKSGEFSQTSQLGKWRPCDTSETLQTTVGSCPKCKKVLPPLEYCAESGKWIDAYRHGVFPCGLKMGWWGLKGALRSDGWLSHRRLCIHRPSEFSVPFLPETLSPRKDGQKQHLALKLKPG